MKHNQEEIINLIDSRDNLKDALERIDQQAMFGLEFYTQSKEMRNIFCTILDIIKITKDNSSTNWEKNYEE